RRIPNLVDEIPSRLHFFPMEAQILTWGRASQQEEAQRIGPVFLDDIHRVDAVSERFAHFAAFCITNQPMDEDIFKRSLPGEFERLEYHAGNPEENDVVAGDEHIRRE